MNRGGQRVVACAADAGDGLVAVERRELTRSERRGLFDAFGALRSEARLILLDATDTRNQWDAVQSLVDGIEFGRLEYRVVLQSLREGRGRR